MFFFSLFAGLILFPPFATARIFNMKKESFASYLRGNYDVNVPGQNSFSNSSGNKLTFDGGQTNSYGYEFGMVFSSGVVNTKLGVEVLQPPEAKGIAAKNTAGTELYKLDTAISDIILKMGFEFNLKTWVVSRFYMLAEGGYASLTLQNSYTFNSVGAAAFGLQDFREELKSSAMMAGGALGFETLLSDTTTFTIDLGYRYLNHTQLNHNLAVTSFQGPVTKGGIAYENDGVTARKLNLSGFQASIGFRFWL